MFRVPLLVFKEGSWTTVSKLSHNVTGLQAIPQIPKVKASESAVIADEYSKRTHRTQAVPCQAKVLLLSLTEQFPFLTHLKVAALCH